MADLRTDYKDDVLNINTNERRKYRMINNADGTISFEDVTDYAQNGDSFGATDVNTITERVNRSLTGADVVDNLESTATDLPLSSNIGRELNEKIVKIWTTVLTFNCSAGYNEKSYNIYDSIVKIENLERIIPFVVSYDTAGMKPTIALPDHRNGNSTIWIETASAGNVKVAFNMFYRVV